MQYKYFLIGILAGIMNITAYSQEVVINYTRYVDPFIGVENNGNTFPGVSLPFGMVKLGPDCYRRESNSGYLSNGEIWGFSFTHVSGTGGGPKYGNVLVTATMGTLNIVDYSSIRKNEKASPGYYSVELNDYNVKVELTATQKTGFQKYTFQKKGKANILIDLGSFLSRSKAYGEDQELVGSFVKILSSREVQGYTSVRGGWNKGKPYTVYFYAIIDTPSETYGTWKSGKKTDFKKVQTDSGEKTGAYFTYNVQKNQIIRFKAGISYLSIDKAKANLKKENPYWDFKKIRNNAVNQWNKQLSKIQISETSEKIKRMFYTALYHSFLQPTKKTGELKNWPPDKTYYDDYYTNWDTFRTLNPLLVLVDEKREVEIINSMLNIYEKEGYMPDGRSGNDNGLTQGGSNCDLVIADAFVKHVEGIDYEEAFRAMVKDAEISPANARKEGRGGIKDYNTLGYVSTSNERAGTRTVEYANDDWGIAQVAKGLGKLDDFEKYKKRASNWKNLWRPVTSHGVTGFIYPKDKAGEWVLGFSLLKRGTWPDFFYESTSWEYSLYVPQDVRGLIKLSGGKDAFITRLDTFFERDYFNIGNEPGFLVPDLYIWAGRYDKSAYRIHKIICEGYNSGRGGLPGNDDSGAMSSWFAFQAMGIFPNAGQDVYLIGSPIVGKTEIKLGNGKIFEIKVHNLSNENIYVTKAILNGNLLNRAWFRHTDIRDGGKLELFMSDVPNNWGTKNPPPSLSDSIY